MRVEAHDRKRLEQLCRYITRPALSDERVQLNDAGQVELKLKTPWRDGTTHLVMSPLEFMQRLAALVPGPRLHLIRYHGVLAPNAKLRAQVVPQGPPAQAPAATEAAAAAECEVEPVQARPHCISWARLLVFRNILLATDGSPASDEAARLAVALAGVHGARLTALYVVDPYPYAGVGEASALGFQAYMSSAYEHAAQAHSRVSNLCESSASPVELRLRRGEDSSATDCIVLTARDEGADLIVVGSHDRSGVARLMLGSIAGKVVSQSELPVLVARQCANT